jgi:hypothetical protein
MLSMISRKLVMSGFLVIFSISSSFTRDAWMVRQDGVGPVEIGMSLAKLNAVLHEKFRMPKNKGDQGCFYVKSKGHPHVLFMMEDGQLARVDVNAAGPATSKGVRVGDSEERVKQIYGSALQIGPHHYTDGHYLTIKSSSGRYGIRFETEQGRVERFYAGKFQSIQYVEGCQ